MKTFSRYHFHGQHDNEQILRVVHRHWFDILSNFFIVIILAFFLIGSLLFFPLLFPEFITAQNWRIVIFIENTMFIFLWLYGFLVWIDYYFDVWIITNERIVNIEQKGLFTRHISEMRFSRVQDVKSNVDGLIQTVLNYGDVIVQTAAAEERFVFRQVPDPYAIKDEVMRLSRSAIGDDARHMAGAFKESGVTPTA